MKVIALLPVLNEEWILPTYISQMRRFTGEILAIDSGSSDRSIELLRSSKIIVRLIRRDKYKKNGSIIRNELLKWGRQSGGTHFICLDADEVFSSNYLQSFPTYLAKMKPGQKLWMDWIPMWKNSLSMLSDKSYIWTKLQKDVVYCDDGKTRHDVELIHEGRTPGSNDGKNLIRVPRSDGVALHYQFVNWQRFQAKQSWYRCLELVTNHTSPDAINDMYAFTLKGKNANTTQTPTSWTKEIIPPKEYKYLSYIEETKGLFDRFGIQTFESLDIWHIDELKEAFITSVGRLPRPLHPLYRTLIKLKQIKKAMHKVYFHVTH